MLAKSHRLLAVLLVGAGCSGIEDAGLNDQTDVDDGDGESSVGTNSDEGETDQAEDEDSGDTSTDDGTDTGPDPGPTDPSLETSGCDSMDSEVIEYDLTEAQAEIAATFVRESVMAHGEVPLVPLSPRPFLNHFSFDHPAAESTLAITGELWKPQSMINMASPRYYLHFAVSGPPMSEADRPSVDLAIVVDIGPSMAGFPIELADGALGLVAKSLRGGDRVTLISAGDTAESLITTVVQDGVEPTLPSLLGEVPQASGAAIADAMALAYLQLQTEPPTESEPRVLLISAGHFTIDASLLELVGSQADEGIALTSVGVGSPDGFLPSSLDELGAVGRGPSLYGPNLDQLALDLGPRFASNMFTRAHDVSVTLTLPPGLAISEGDPSWGGDAPRVLELGTIGPNDMLVFQQELQGCGELDPEAAVEVEVEWQEPNLGETQSLVWQLPVADLGFGAMSTRKGAAVLAYVDALIAYRDGLGADARYGALLDALGQISEALEAMPEDPDLIEMSEVLALLESE